MNLEEFVTAHNGKYVNFDTMYPNQCMDLHRQYVQDVLGFPQSNGVSNAWQVFFNFDPALWEKIPYKNGLSPTPGCVVIWSKWKSPSLTGHIAVCVEADVNHMTCFSQNDPGGTPAMLREYSYTRVLGWLRPIIPVPVGGL